MNQGESPRGGSAAIREVLAITVILSACSLMYELLIAQTLSLLAGNTVVWYSLIVGVYLGAMGLGALVFKPHHSSEGWNRLFAVELLLAGTGAAAVPIIQLAHSLHLYLEPASAGIMVFVFFGISLVMTVLVGALSGIELPLLMDIGNDLAGSDRVTYKVTQRVTRGITRRITHRVLAWDYIGALVAGVVFPLVLLPLLSLPAIGHIEPHGRGLPARPVRTGRPGENGQGDRGRRDGRSSGIRDVAREYDAAVLPQAVLLPPRSS